MRLFILSSENFDSSFHFKWIRLVLMVMALVIVLSFGAAAQSTNELVSDAIEREVAYRACISNCQARHGMDYPCKEECNLRVCEEKARAGEDRRFMPVDSRRPDTHPDCTPHQHVLKMAMQTYQQRRTDKELGNVRELIEKARKHAQEAKDAIAEAEVAWQYVDRIDPLASQPFAVLDNAESIVSEARDACARAPSIAEMDAARRNVLMAADEARSLKSRVHDLTERACKIATRPEQAGHDPYQTNVIEKADALISQGNILNDTVKKIAAQSATRTGQIIVMEKERIQARGKVENAYSVIESAKTAVLKSMAELSRIRPQVNACFRFIDIARKEAAMASELKSEALSILERIHRSVVSQLEAGNRSIILGQVSELITQCSAIDIPDQTSAEKQLKEIIETIDTALTRLRDAMNRIEGMKASLSACNHLAQSMDDMIREAQGASDEAQRDGQQISAMIAGAEQCANTNKPDANADRCAEIAAELNAAVRANDLDRYRYLVGQSQGCNFHQQAVADLNRIEANNKKCQELAQAMDAARNTGNWQRFRVLLPQAKDCTFYEQAVTDYNNALRTQQQTGNQQLLNNIQSIMRGMQTPTTRPPVPAQPPKVRTQRTPIHSTKPPAAAAPTKRCEQVCVQKKVEWKNVSDGRHSLCAGGVARPPGPGLRPPKCVRSEICTKWETRCK